MRIGKQDAPYTAICTSDAESITVRGRDLCRDLIGKVDFTSYFWLLVTGIEPNETQRYLADAVLVAIAEHGLVPSVVAARMKAGSSSSFAINRSQASTSRISALSKKLWPPDTV